MKIDLHNEKKNWSFFSCISFLTEIASDLLKIYHLEQTIIWK